MRTRLSIFLGEALIAGTLLGLGAAYAQTPAPTAGASTPIQHLVVIFQENVSFDHYFGTYPFAMNPEGEPAFYAYPNTPSVNGLSPGHPERQRDVSEFSQWHGRNRALPPGSIAGRNRRSGSRLYRRTNRLSQRAGGSVPDGHRHRGPPPSNIPQGSTTGLVMGYYDGNTVTAFWNYAQHYAMSDNSYGTNFGPSTDGALNVISGQLNGAINNTNGTGSLIEDGSGGMTVISDADPAGDVCSTTTGETFSMSGKNIGDLLNAAGVSWGFFEGGFDLTVTNPNGTTGCSRSTRR